MGIFLSKKMRYFMVIMETKNFGRAAEALCITKSPLSKVLSELEYSLGGKLFIRKYNGLDPTALAWDCYNRCLPAYQRLMAFEEEFTNLAQDSYTSIHFDMSVPYSFFHYMQRIVHPENLKFQIKREVVTSEDLLSINCKHNAAIISFRQLETENRSFCDTWHGCHHVILHRTSNDNCYNNKFFVWKDQYTHYHKSRIKEILSFTDIEPDFIEHNHDLFSLLSFIREGKGMILSTEKLANFVRLEGIDIEVIDRSYIRCFTYHNNNNIKSTTLPSFKALLNQFI